MAIKHDVTIVIVGGAVPAILNRRRRGSIVLHLERRHYDFYTGTPAEAPLFEIDQTEARGLRGGAKEDDKANKRGDWRTAPRSQPGARASRAHQEDEEREMKWEWRESRLQGGGPKKEKDMRRTKGAARQRCAGKYWATKDCKKPYAWRRPLCPYETVAKRCKVMRAKHLAISHPDAHIDLSVFTILGSDHRVREPRKKGKLLWSCPMGMKGIVDLEDNTGEANLRRPRFQQHEQEHLKADRMSFRKDCTAERGLVWAVARTNREATMRLHRLRSGSAGEHELRPVPAARPYPKGAHKERVRACAQRRTTDDFWWYPQRDCRCVDVFLRRLCYERLIALARKFPDHTQQFRYEVNFRRGGPIESFPEVKTLDGDSEGHDAEANGRSTRRSTQ